MATSLRYAAELREENPYAAPQTRDMVLPLALERAELRLTRTDEVLPRSTQRWLNVALAVYGVSFVVPLITSVDRWTPFMGIFFFFMAALMCWHPLMWCWWANVFFYLSRRNMHRGRSQRACVYAGIGALAAASLMVIGFWGGRGDDYYMNMTLNPPYLCWLAAMLLQWIAAVDMRRFNKNQCRPIRSRDLL
jgi:hypothetical protein